MEEHREFLPHITIAYDLSVFLDLDLGSFGQLRGHKEEKGIIRLQFIVTFF